MLNCRSVAHDRLCIVMLHLQPFSHLALSFLLSFDLRFSPFQSLGNIHIPLFPFQTVRGGRMNFKFGNSHLGALWEQQEAGIDSLRLLRT